MNYSRKQKGFLEILGEYRLRFVFWFLLNFFVVFSVLYLAGFIPEAIAPQPKGAHIEKAEFQDPGAEPLHIVIGAVGIDVRILNPKSTDIKVLDESLKEGVVRYPTSGLAGKGHMFLFGHSTGFKVVQNPAYKAFNGLKDVKEGDTIVVASSEKEYIYKVKSVTLANSETAFVELSGNEKKLTLSTCNTFGKKEERYVVEADFVESKTLFQVI